MAAGFAGAILIGIGQVLHAHMVPDGWARAHAFVHPVTFGEQVCVAMLGMVCFLAKPQGALEKRSEKWAVWTLLLLACAALLLSQTRGAIVAFAAGLGALCWHVPKLRRPFIIAMFFAIVSLAEAGSSPVSACRRDWPLMRSSTRKS